MGVKGTAIILRSPVVSQLRDDYNCSPYTGLPALDQPGASPLQLGLTLLHFLFPTYKQTISIRIQSTPDSYSPTGKTNDGVKRKKTAWILGGDPRFRELPGGLSVPVTISAP